MSAEHANPGNRILSGSPLAQALDDYAVPNLGAGFAERVLSAADTRAAPLPELRRKGGGGSRRRLGRRITIAALGFGALASAAAATGLLERFDIPVPSPEKVWTSLTGKEAPSTAMPAASTPANLAIPMPAPVVIVGPIDTPEELGEAFRRIDEVRKGRIEARRKLINQRVDHAIERRRAAGLPVPTAEQEARLRQRIDDAQDLRQQRADERITVRRDELERKVENGEALTREDFIRPTRDDPATAACRERLRQLQKMTPQQRRESLRRVPPEQRRALIEEYRARQNASAAPPTGSASEIPAAVSEVASTEPPAELQP